ncbi:MAG: serine/threonine-protein kinase [Verrucomicrobiia bacterium]|jgi:serine/threonine protein kinase
MKNIIFADAGGGVFVVTWLAIAVIACFIAIQIKRRTSIELGIFGLILEKIGVNKIPAPTPAPPTQILHHKCPQCGAEQRPDASEGLCPACLLQRGIATEGGTPPNSPPFTPPTVPELAKLFPQLEILELIGKGGMGAVYKARQPALDRFVALKILATRSGGDLDFAERFTREARALAKLSHPNIVAVYDFGQIQRSAGVPLAAPDAGGTPALHYFIMEFVDGPNLRQIEQAGRLAPRQALEIIPQICGALQFAHDEGIVHRDIKPENILLDKKGRVKIADFGLAKILGQEPKDFRLTGVRDVVGTPHYMAPEQIEKPAEVDHRADIYSLGVVFYEMLTGELPLGKFQPPSSCTRTVQIDVRLDEVVLHALEKEPAQRYQQASQVKTDVETIVTTPANHNSIQRKEKNMGISSYKPLWYGLAIGAVCLLIGLTAWLATRPPKFSLNNIDAKIVRLSRPGTTVKQVIHVLGEPAEYVWGDESHIQQRHRLPDNPPEFYVLLYPGAVRVAVNHDRVVELRSQGQGPGFTYRGKLHLGSSLDDVLEVLGEPAETVVGKPMDFSAMGVLQKDIDGNKGWCYYALSDQHVRLFFGSPAGETHDLDYKVTALYITVGEEGGMAVATGTVDPEIDSKIAQLSKPGTTVDDTVRTLGEPQKYVWGDKTFQKDKLPDRYIALYPGDVQVAVFNGKVFELRSEGQGPGFTYRGKLHLGSSLDDVLKLLGPPTETIVGKPIDFSARSVLYRDVDGRKGFDYYARPDQNIRCFFANNKVTALYVTLDADNR